MTEERNPITPEELRYIAQDIRIGDIIEWRVPDASLEREKGGSKRKRLKVIGKSRHFLVAANKGGGKYSIRYAEIAEARRKARSQAEQTVEKFKALNG